MVKNRGLLFSNFPTPPSSADVTEAQRLLTSFDVFTEIYYAAFTSMFLILAGLLWQTRVFCMASLWLIL